MNAIPKPKREPRMTIVHEVEFDISEFDDDALMAELQRRALELGSSECDIEDLFMAMKWGNHKRALELLRVYLMNVTGRVLP